MEKYAFALNCLLQGSVSCNCLLILRNTDHVGLRFKTSALRNPVTGEHIGASDLSLSSRSTNSKGESLSNAGTKRIHFQVTGRQGI
jgi:hypothetical protein